MEYQIHISHYSKQGHGLGIVHKTSNGSPKFVEVVGTVVGDTVIATLGKGGKTILEKVISPSLHRVHPRCPHVGRCGGCTWQQQQYRTQLETKEKEIATLFGKKGLPIIPSAVPWYYRNKMEYTFSQNKEGKKFLGLIIPRSKRAVINLKECHLTPSWFIDVLASVRSWWETSYLQAYHPRSDRGTLRTLTILEGKRTGDKMIFITISGNSDYMINKTEIEGFKKGVLHPLQKKNPSIFLRIQRIAKKTPTRYYEMHLHGPDCIKEILYIHRRSLIFKISPQSFFQPNPLQAEKLYTQALELISPQPSDILLDLYCGIGALGMVFAPYVKKVIGVEINSYAICDARLNIQENNLANMILYQEDVGRFLSQFALKVDIILIDPPRSGLDQRAIDALIKIGVAKILYISCNPLTQSRDVSALISQGYTLTILQPIDQFPHTYHLENIAILEKR